MIKKYKNLVLICCFFSICVVGLGAYTRLSDAGLGCPDWPGCYGFLTVPHHEIHSEVLSENFPGMVLETAKAWKEMIHRYFAGALGVLILVIAIGALLLNKRNIVPTRLPWFLVVLVIFQAALGMLTVTMQLQPLIVMGHLLGGFAIFSLTGLLYLRLCSKPIPGGDEGARPHYYAAILALIVLLVQIALGGWLAANYAASHCADFPLCGPESMQHFSLWEVFQLPMSQSNYEYGVLSYEARMSIHLLHRFWAAITTIIILWALYRIWIHSYSSKIKQCVLTVLCALIAQLTLGVVLVLLQFPISVALAHNLMAAALLLSVIRLSYYIKVHS
ncbi:COX15/CtaA family protein [Pseudoalteromonas tunicata]|uniref:COX15/CtaA family protein n=1 Tax=Pseudoalteromonas tunicata TaxID=314281 RepID=UPI00273EB776|nr:COX15/CtaA family protein [Pseudoalteromonas tunicata]MDP4982682.1 COX15/CtaA family protein [Pseudoalteromonas tunicata]